MASGSIDVAIKRSFANLDGVPDAVEVSWTTGKTIFVQCAGKILSDPDDDAPQFTCPEEDPRRRQPDGR